MHHLQFIGYHIVRCFNIAIVDLYFNTSPMIFLFLDASIYYTLIIQSFQNKFWCGVWFTVTKVYIYYYNSIWQCGTPDLWVTGSSLLPHMVSASVLFPVIYLNSVKMQNVNVGQPTRNGLYPHMTPQTHKLFIIKGHLISNF